MGRAGRRQCSGRDLHECGDHRRGGIRGRSRQFDEFTAEPESFDDQGDTVVVTGRFKGKSKSGQELDASFEHVYRMKDGKIARLENNVDQDAWAAAWS